MGASRRGYFSMFTLNLIRSSLFKLLLKEPLHIDSLMMKPHTIWPQFPFCYDEKLWKIEFDSDLHFSNYCSKSHFPLLIHYWSPFLFGLKSLFIMTKSFRKSNLILIFTFKNYCSKSPFILILI